MDVTTTIMQMIVEVNARTANYALGCRRVSGNTHAFDLYYRQEMVCNPGVRSSSSLYIYVPCRAIASTLGDVEICSSILFSVAGRPPA